VVEDCELLAEGRISSCNGGTAPNRSTRAMEQGDKDGSHAGHATKEVPEKVKNYEDRRSFLQAQHRGGRKCAGNLQETRLRIRMRF